jgi:8-oxo-dGTP diphosphatase
MLPVNQIDIVLFSVDPVIFTLINGRLHILAVKRTAEPFINQWGLPGGRVDKSCKNIDEALALKLKEKTGLSNIYFEQMQTYGSIDMDPRGWSVTTAYIALVNAQDIDFSLKSSQPNPPVWLLLDDVINDHIKMAFWHRQIIFDAVQRLKNKSLYTDLPVNLMPKTFTYATLRAAYEEILGFPITRQSFAKRIEDANILVDTGKKERGSNRPSTLYRKKAQGGSHYFPRELRQD